MPASNTISALMICQIKIYLRTSITQPKLNHMMVLHIHEHLIDEISHASVLNEFDFANDQENHSLVEISNISFVFKCMYDIHDCCIF